MAYFFLMEIEEVIKNIIVLVGIFKMPVKDKKIVVGATIAFVSTSILRYIRWEAYDIKFQLIGIVISYIWIIFISADIWWRSCLYFFMTRILINCIDEIISVIAFFCGTDVDWLLKNDIKQSAVVNSISIFLFAFIAFKRKYRLSEKEKMPYIYYLIPCGASAFSMALLAACQLMLMDYKEKYNKIIFAVCIACCVLLILLGILLMFFLQSRQYYKQLYELRNKFQQLQNEHFKELHAKTMEFRRLRHDYHHKVGYMSELAALQRWDEITEFLGGMKDEYDRTMVISTGYFPGDAVVNHFYEKMQNKGIELDWMGSFPEKLQIEETEFCSLLSNLLENAVESCERVIAKDGQGTIGLQKLVVRVEVQKDDEFLFLDISNPAVTCEGKFSLSTSKTETDEHGIGTQNIKKIAEKYDGDATWEFVSGEVKASVIIKYKD